jgi:ATP-dependent Clp protease adaptor protein ClpS
MTVTSLLALFFRQRAVRITLSRESVPPLLELIREERIALEKASAHPNLAGIVSQSEPSIGWRKKPIHLTDLERFLALFPPDFPATKIITVSTSEAGSVLRACSLLRLHLRMTQPTAVPEEAFESAEALPTNQYPDDVRRTILTYQFLATLQRAVLNPAILPASRSNSITGFFRRCASFVPRSNDKIKGASKAALEPVANANPAPTGAWRVVVLDDPVNLMEYVAAVFGHVLDLPADVARRRMLEVHERRRSIVWTGPRQAAETYVSRLQFWHLKVVLEPPDL